MMVTAPHPAVSTGTPAPRWLPKPPLLSQAEATLGGALRVHPHLLSALKLAVTPAVLAALATPQLPGRRWVVALLLGAFFALDALDGVVARARGLESRAGRIIDRISDAPLLLGVSWHCLDLVPLPLLLTKVGLDLSAALLYAAGRGSTENRLRTVVSHAGLLALLALSQGWLPARFPAEAVAWLMLLSIGVTSLVVLRQTGVLRSGNLADTLSALNLVCGVLSVRFAWEGRVEVSVLLLLVGALFDGLDGAAARRFGGGPFGVYADDIADGVSYGLAPGVAVAATLGGVSGVIVGGVLAVLVWTRLVYFTLHKGSTPSGWFGGAPSTVGGLIALCAAALFADEPALLGLLVGVAGAQMVAFDLHYRHLGHAVGQAIHRRARRVWGAPPLLLGLPVAWAVGGPHIPVAVLLGLALAYGFGPSATALLRSRA